MGLLELPRFELVTSVISSAAACMSQIAMILTGFVIGSYRLSTLFKQWRTYVITLIRLVGLPAVIAGVLRLLNTPNEIVIAALCGNAMPLGLNTVIIPSAYGEQPETGASLALVSQLSSVVTIPAMFLIFTGI